MLKMKNNSTKSSTIFENGKTNNSPILAWDCIQKSEIQSNQEKQTKNHLFKFKKNSKKKVDLIDEQYYVESPRLLNAFNTTYRKSNEEKGNSTKNSGNSTTSLRKSSSVDIINMSDDQETTIIIYPLNSTSDKIDKKNENKKPVIITVVSSDESSAVDTLPIKSKKQSKSKTKLKKQKSRVETSEVYYFRRENKNGLNSTTENDYPWTPDAYKPDFNEDEILDQNLTLYQLINILNHSELKLKTVMIDLRNYDSYQTNPIFGVKHYSEYQDKQCQFAISKVKAGNFSIVVLMYSKYPNDLDIRSIEKLKIFQIKFNDEFEQQLESLINKTSIDKSLNSFTFSCFDSGTLLFSENFEKTLDWLSELKINGIITDNKQKVYHKLSAKHNSNNNTIPLMIGISSEEVNTGDYSDKAIANSKLQEMLDHLSDCLVDNSRLLILIDDSDQLSLTILILVLMYKNHWSLQDSISCVKYVRSISFQLKQNPLNILKCFEKLFFGKRLYSGGSKSKLREDFAVEI